MGSALVDLERRAPGPLGAVGQLLAGMAMRWHLCSLDAPTVAVVWAAALGRMAGVRLGWAELGVLALGTWIVYVLDRVLDGLRDAAGGLEERHHFARRHRRVLLRLCCLAACGLGFLCLRIPAGLVGVYLLLGAPVGVYALRVHAPLLLKEGAAPVSSRSKEVAVAVLFTSAVAAPAFVAAGASFFATGASFVFAGTAAPLLCATLLLAGLCWLNCAVIGLAEKAGSDRAAGRRSDRSLLTGAALALAMGSALCCGWSASRARNAPPLLSLAASSLLLGLLVQLLPAKKVRPEMFRVLADLALLTPLVFLIAGL